MDMIVFLNIKPEDHEMLTKILGTSNDKHVHVDFAQIRKEKKEKKQAFYDAKDTLKEGNSILCCRDESEIFFTEKIPDEPGVYAFYDQKADMPIYIGSSKKLSQRIPQSFIERKGVSNVKYIAVLQTDNEECARDLEATLISQYRPKMNVLIPEKRNNVNFNVRDQLNLTVLKWRVD